MEQGVVRKIVVGRDPKNGMAYYIGMRAGDNKVSAILLDEEHLYRYKLVRYLIYVENENETMLWKSLDEMPCIIEYNLNF
jgi:hypothetical protein